jgi:hypothetical protein
MIKIKNPFSNFVSRRSKHMNIPQDKEIIDAPLTTFWFDDEGILHGIAKSKPRSLTALEENTQFVKRFLKGRRAAVIMNVTNSSPYDDERGREYFKKQIPFLYKAIGIVATSDLGKMIAAMISIMAPLDVHTRIFNSREDAIEWIRTLRS